MTALLAGKNVLIYGAGGGIGRGVATRFAQEGAAVFLAGRTQAPLDALAGDIGAAGGRAEVAGPADAATDTRRSGAEEDAVTAAVKAGDELAFAGLVECHRRELHVHRSWGTFRGDAVGGRAGATGAG